jgi:hypothetical protein
MAGNAKYDSFSVDKIKNIKKAKDNISLLQRSSHECAIIKRLILFLEHSLGFPRC